ncbi:MAG: ATP-binding protein [Spirochaetes bacterium]|nr:ATP-binding protein [Spirochaetota bacterium]
MVDTIAVISGKGGTGKSSLTRAFFELEKNAYAADCDVDGANLFVSLDHDIVESEDFIAGFDYEIDAEKCVHCSKCEKLCRFGAIKDFKIDSFLCEGCNVCYYVCGSEAVKKSPKNCGKIHRAKSNAGFFVYGRLVAGEENSGKMVSRVREISKKHAEEIGSAMLIIDGPPGVGCPVIASVTATTGVVIVTEPTLSGLSDLKRAAGLVTGMNIPVSIVINRADINTEICEQIEKFAADNALSFAGRINYSAIFNESQRDRRSVVSYEESSAADEVKKVWKNIRKDLLKQEK